MSRLRFKLAADEEQVQPQSVEQPIEQPEQPIQEEVIQEEPIQEEPAQEPVREEIQETEPVQEQVQELEAPETADEKPAQESTEHSVLKDYPDGYTNQWGKVTPYHILFKDYGTDISSMTGPQALELCLNTMDELEEKYRGDHDYMNPSGDAISKFKKECTKAKTGMDVMFTLKDFLLATEGHGTTASLKDAFANPKIAKRVANVFNTLIALHENSKKK